jgi:hypothetical protein
MKYLRVLIILISSLWVHIILADIIIWILIDFLSRHPSQLFMFIIFFIIRWSISFLVHTNWFQVFVISKLLHSFINLLDNKPLFIYFRINTQEVNKVLDWLIVLSYPFILQYIKEYLSLNEIKHNGLLLVRIIDIYHLWIYIIFAK